MQGNSWLRPRTFPLQNSGPEYIQVSEDNEESNKKLDVSPFGIIVYPDTVGDVIPLNIIRPGTQFYNRVGNKISLSKLSFRAVLLDGSRIPFVGKFMSTGYGALAIVYDLQPNGVLPSWKDVFEDIDMDGNTTISPDSYSGINWNNRDRFLILYDSRQVLPGGEVNPTGLTPGTTTILWYPDPSNMDHTHWVDIDLKGLNTVYNQLNIGQIDDIMTGALYLLTLGTELPQFNNWLYQWRSRLYFDDI